MSNRVEVQVGRWLFPVLLLAVFPGCVVVVQGRPPIVFYDAWSADYVEVSWAATVGVVVALVACSAALGATTYWLVKERWLSGKPSRQASASGRSPSSDGAGHTEHSP